MTVQGKASAATTSVVLPAHAAGDLIFVFTIRNSVAPPSTPAAGGTVPAWKIAQSAGSDALSLVSAWAIATASNMTTGTWTNALNIITLILRPSAGISLTVGKSSTTNGITTTSFVFPALTVSRFSTSSWGVRSGVRNAAEAANATPPAGWTNQIFFNNVTAIHTLASLTSNPTQDTVTGTLTTNAYRSHTIEVIEMIPPNPMVTIV